MTIKEIKTKWLLLFPLVLLGGGAIWGSHYLRDRTISQMQTMLQSHVNSVTALVKKSVAQGAWSTATIYSLYEERLLTTAYLFSMLSEAQQQSLDTLEAEQISVFLPSLSSTGFGAHWGSIPVSMRQSFVSEMQQAPSLELLETALLRKLGLICMVYEGSNKGVLCHSDTSITELRRASGIGPLLDELIQAHLSWVVLQDAGGVIAAAPRNAAVSRWKDDALLQQVVADRNAQTRATQRGNVSHMEGISPFRMVDGSWVVVRVAVDATVFEQVRQSAHQRHYTTVVLIIIVELLLLGAISLVLRWRSRQRQIEQTLALQEEEKKHWELIGGLSATVAHEVRNPLSTIAMTSERLKCEFSIPESERADFEHLLQILQKESKQLNKIVTDFLELGKPGKLTLEEIEVGRFVSEVADHFAVRAATEEKKLITTVDSSAVVQLDRRRLHQVLNNLVNNALDASSAGSSISITVTDTEQEVTVTVLDEGSGMTDEQLEKAMEPFVSFKANGTGLGLALVSRLITLHHGYFSLSRNPHKGMTATIRLPRTLAGSAGVSEISGA